jgi:hypothetical protein
MKLNKTILLIPLILSTLISFTARASFHLWTIEEVYSNADGSLQFIELFSNSSGQEFLIGHDITVRPGTGSNITFSFPTNSPAPTNSKSLLLATRDFQAVTGIEPDFIIPTGFIPKGSTNLSFAGVDSLRLTSLPLDGTQSLNGSESIAAATPRNFAGNSGSVPSIEVTFDASMGSLNIPFVSVEELGNYNATLKLVEGEGLQFELVSAELLSSLIAQDVARLKLATGVMTLPRVKVGNEVFSATLLLQNIPNVFRFVVTSAELIQE